MYVGQWSRRALTDVTQSSQVIWINKEKEWVGLLDVRQRL
jgi:hypothetical protein